MIFTRHGETEYLEYTSGEQFDLTGSGINQATELGISLKGIEFPVIVSSEQYRAKAFAQILYDILGGSILVDTSLNSFVGEDIQGYREEIERINGRIYSFYQAGELDDRPGILVPRKEIQRRKKQFLQNHTGNVIAVTHREVIDQWFDRDIAKGQMVNI